MIRSSAALTVAPITRDILVAAATLRATSTLKLPDAIHAATALEQLNSGSSATPE